MNNQFFSRFNITTFKRHTAATVTAIIAAFFVMQGCLTDNCLWNSITYGFFFLVEAVVFGMTVAIINGATLCSIFILSGTKRLNLQRTGDFWLFEFIRDDVQVENGHGTENVRIASINDYPSKDTFPKTESSPVSASSVAAQSKRPSPLQIERPLDPNEWDPLVNPLIGASPFELSNESLKADMFSPIATSIFSPSSLASCTNKARFSEPSTPPAWLGRKMMSTASPSTIGSPSPSRVINALKTRRATPYPSKRMKASDHAEDTSKVEMSNAPNFGRSQIFAEDVDDTSL